MLRGDELGLLICSHRSKDVNKFVPRAINFMHQVTNLRVHLFTYFAHICSQEVLVQTKETSAGLTEVVWQGNAVPVKNERVRLSLVKLHQMAGEVERMAETEEKIRLCEELLMECQDGIQLVRDEINQDSVSLVCF